MVLLWMWQQKQDASIGHSILYEESLPSAEASMVITAELPTKPMLKGVQKANQILLILEINCNSSGIIVLRFLGARRPC